MHAHPHSPTELSITGDDRLPAWREEVRVPVPGHQFTPAFKADRWDGLLRPGKWCRRHGPGWELRCGRGLLGLLSQAFPDLTVGEGVRPPPLPIEALTSLRETLEPLRDYQREAVLRGLTAGWGRIALATNAGKGAVIAIQAAYLASAGYRVLICCDEIAVHDALQGELAKWAGDLPIGIVESGVTEPPEEAVVLAMVPTLAKRLPGAEGKPWRTWVGGFHAALLDEADKATAKTWRSILTAARSTIWRIGFSGTFPQAGSHAALVVEELLGPELVQAGNLEMVERGVSARPRVHLHAYDVAPALYPDVPPRTWWKWTGAERRLWVYERAIMMNEDRHRFLASLIRPGVPTAIIVNRVDHGHALLPHLPEGSRYLDGSVSKTERRAALDAFADGEFHVLIVTKILDRGSNRLGHTLDLIFASGEGSRRQSLQRLGRGLRKVEGKTSLVLRDVLDRGHKYLHKAVEKRIRTYHAEGFDVVLHPTPDTTSSLREAAASRSQAVDVPTPQAGHANEAPTPPGGDGATGRPPIPPGGAHGPGGA